MKKMISVLILTTVLTQFSINEVRAQQVYDDVFDSGSLFITNNLDDTLEIFDAGHLVPFTSSTVSISNPYFGAFLLNGDAVLTTSDQKVFCKTRNSGYSSDCAWSGATGLTLSSNTYINPRNGVISNPGTNVLNTFASLSIVVASNDDIWIPQINGTGTGRFLIRLVAPTYSTIQVYDMRFFECSVNPATDPEESCGGTWSAQLNFMPGMTDIDTFGRIWTPSYYNGVSFNDDVLCLQYNISTTRYESCSSSGFDLFGAVNVAGSAGNVGLYIDKATNLMYVPSIGVNKLYKVDINNNFSVSSISSVFSAGSLPFFGHLDNLGRFWVVGHQTGFGPSENTATIKCFDSSLSACAGVGSIQYNVSRDQAAGLFLDKNGDLWAGRYAQCTANSGPNNHYLNPTDCSNAAGTWVQARAYCFDASNSYSGCAQSGSVYNGNANFTNITEGANNNSYLTVGSVSGGFSYLSGGFFADENGSEINKLADAVLGQDQVDIAATVDPTISLTLSSNTCSLGNLTTASANTCTYDVTTATNAANGLVVKFSADTAYLASGSNNIDACASSGCTGGVNAGTEEYGFYVSTVGSAHDATGYDADSEPLPTSATTVITAIDPHTDTTSTITHKAAVSPVTPAGAYSHVVTITAVGSF